ncbi:Phosphoserine phosphatase RsbU [Planktothrix tepida]|uniref:Protein serine/threonine phosphatase with extracellular sensor n=2 Tax=Planktothrix TaxID=54304 RepID=A0A1J1LG67_9CYAN|nr:MULTISPECIES: PP2C family protein-serine/threonine phosphatase [Planktothrix]CAD5914712.1 Phosphoserine phosphatase RsbU [Planktothrix tepida]CAD5986110.1 Phosphoserine phosphatase RsbU [Planktothrix pseudagardhii]CUR30569.1 Protein serine/threonine phosphatase with extracellular sensor [Planktothrix tepida PCC 9214]
MKIINFFKPAISVINQLKYPQKFVLISCIFIIPLSLMMYLLISEVQTRIDFATQEQLGTLYLRPLRQLYPKIYQAQLLMANPNLSGKDQAQLEQLKRDITDQIKTLENLDNKIGNKLLTTNLFKELQDSWRTLEENQKLWSLQTQKVYSSLILEQINQLRFQVGDQSNLILDPDLDTYYLMDTTLLKLPEIHKILVDILLISQDISQRDQQQLTPKEYWTITTLSGLLTNYNEKLKRSLEVSFNHNPAGNLQPKLGEKLNLLTDNIQTLNNGLSNIIRTGDTTNIQQYAQNAELNIQQSLRLWDLTIDELDFLLQRRVQGFMARQLFLGILVLIPLLIVIYLFIGFYQSVMQTVNSLSIASQKMIAGEMNETLYLENQDELADVAQSFNNLAVALVKANQEITSLNQQLTSENLRMSAELQVTRQLQKMILPNDRELSEIVHLDIAGYMEPADEVGGDYYDVLYNNGMVKIGIGDVTGHGLESGVLMLMVQTAVRTLTTNNETDPIQFLNTLNRVIYDNVQRMKSDKNLTFSLIDYYNGFLSICGQHEEMIVVRSQLQPDSKYHPVIERIDTMDLGFPIGLEADITDFIGSINIKLNPGDGVVLYTDGITEAENHQGEFYSLEKLCEIVKQHWHLTASEIRKAVINDVRSHIGKHKVYDDITLVVMKQK